MCQQFGWFSALRQCIRVFSVRCQSDIFVALSLNLLIGVIFVESLFAQSYPKQMSLKESVDYALAHNLRLKNQALEQQITYKEITREIIALGLPNLEVKANYDYNIAIANVFLPNFISPLVYGILDEEELAPFPRDRDFGITPAQFGTDHNVRAGLELNQLLVDFTYFLGIRAAGMLREQADKKFIQSKIELVNYVHQAYYMALISERHTSLIAQNRHRLEQLLRDTQLRYDQGFTEQIDVDRVQVSLNLISAEYARAEAQEALSRHVLNFQLSLPVEHPLELSDSLVVEQFSELLLESSITPPSVRIEYDQLSLLTEISRQHLKGMRLSRYPSLSLRATAGYNTGRNEIGQLVSDAWFPYSVLSFNFKFPIFNGLRTSMQIQEQSLKLAQLENERSQLQRALLREQTQARNDLHSRVEALNAQEENLRLARRVYETTREKYQQGIGSNLEVLTAATTLKEVETQYYTALYEALIARISFQKAHGTLHPKT